MTHCVELPKPNDEGSGYAIKASHVLSGGQQLCTQKSVRRISSEEKFL